MAGCGGDACAAFLLAEDGDAECVEVPMSDGGEGFDDDPNVYPGLSNTYAVRGDEGSSFSKLAAVDSAMEAIW